LPINKLYLSSSLKILIKEINHRCLTKKQKISILVAFAHVRWAEAGIVIAVGVAPASHVGVGCPRRNSHAIAT
jgi:hypothetical protein